METPDSASANSAENLDIEQKLNHLTQQIEYEESQWREAGISPQMIGIDGYMLRVQSSFVLSLLKDLMNKSTDEMNVLFKEHSLQVLQEDRINILNARAASLVVAKAQLFGPDGNPIANGN